MAVDCDTEEPHPPPLKRTSLSKHEESGIQFQWSEQKMSLITDALAVVPILSAHMSALAVLSCTC